MHLILCVDTRKGLSFCGKRLSRDCALISHILQLTAGVPLWVSPYSASLFPDTVHVSQDFQAMAGDGEYAFLETAPFLSQYDDLESVILYCWNRAYPATESMPPTLLDGMHLCAQEEFAGTSHEKITMQRYRK